MSPDRADVERLRADGQPELIPYQPSFSPTTPTSRSPPVMLLLQNSLVARPLRQQACLRRLLATSTAPTFKIPVIDFGKFRLAATRAERDTAAGQVVDALITAGFMVRRLVASVLTSFC